MKPEIIVLALPVRLDSYWFVKAPHFQFGLGFEVIVETALEERTYSNVSEVIFDGEDIFILNSYSRGGATVTIYLGEIVRLKVNKSRRASGSFLSSKSLAATS